MRILVVSWGYSPLFHGGVTVYTEDLLRALVSRGHQVHYFCCGRSDLRLAPHIREWKRDGISVYELRNPPAREMPYTGTHHPERDIDDAGTRRLFRQVLEQVRPDAVHVVEFLGLPARIVDDVKAAGIRLVVTLLDFHCLCPTQLLFRRETGETCGDFESGAACVRCCQKAPAETQLTRLKSAAWHAGAVLRKRAPGVWKTISRAGYASLGAASALRPTNGNGNSNGTPAAPALAAAYRTRREEFIRLLDRADVLHAFSTALRDVFVRHGSRNQFVTINASVAALGSIRPVTHAPGRPLAFSFSGAFSKGKGAEIALRAFEGISPRDAVLHVYGDVEEPVRPALAAAEAAGRVRYHGRYARGELQAVLDRTDVAVMPAVWMETCSVTGLEFKAARIPIIASDLGGFRDYIVSGRDGFLIQPGSAAELRQAMQRFIDDPALVLRFRERISPVQSLQQHASEIEALYGLCPA